MLSPLIFSTGCANGRAALLLNEAAEADAAADVVDQALAEASKLPERPADCRRRERSGVAQGDRLDVAWLKAERALGRANARIDRCAAWDDDFRKGLAQ